MRRPSAVERRRQAVGCRQGRTRRRKEGRKEAVSAAARHCLPLEKEEEEEEEEAELPCFFFFLGAMITGHFIQREREKRRRRWRQRQRRRLTYTHIGTRRQQQQMGDLGRRSGRCLRCSHVTSLHSHFVEYVVQLCSSVLTLTCGVRIPESG
jgi:hypothetical protein